MSYSKNRSEFKPLKRKKDIRGKIVEKEGAEYWLEEDWLRKEFGKYGICYYEQIAKYKGEKKKIEIDKGLQEGLYQLVRKGKYHIVARFRKLEEDGSKFYSILKHLSSKGIDDIREIGVEFDYPKPISLVKELILGATLNKKNESTIVLDSFAGSGTTAHAVLALNKEDGGNRKFILVECENYADEITAQRVRRVIKGIPKAKDENLKGGLGGSFTYCTLGEELSEENLLKGKALPSYETLSNYVFYTATGKNLGKFTENDDFYVTKLGKDTAYFVIYKADREFLRSNDSALSRQRKEAVLKIMKRRKCSKAIVFAAACFCPIKELSAEKITFSQLPFAIYRIAG